LNGRKCSNSSILLRLYKIQDLAIKKKVSLRTFRLLSNHLFLEGNPNEEEKGAMNNCLDHTEETAKRYYQIIKKKSTKVPHFFDTLRCETLSTSNDNNNDDDDDGDLNEIESEVHPTSICPSPDQVDSMPTYFSEEDSMQSPATKRKSLISSSEKNSLEMKKFRKRMLSLKQLLLQ
jgi:hypothetical protein